MGQLPIGITNAHLNDQLVMRVGIPNTGGKLNFHAFNESYQAMVSANAFWDGAKNEFRVPAASDLYELDFALDSAGFTAMQLWKSKGTQKGMAGIFPWSYSQYIELMTLLRPSWWSQPDLTCEPELVANQEEIDFRIDATATLLEGTLRILYAWSDELSKTCNAQTIQNMLPPPVPIVQGWRVSDYERSLELLQRVWERWEPWLAPPALIGVGSVCRRDLMHPEHGLYAILAGLEGKLPDGSRLHLFGCKGSILEKLKMMNFVASSDSMAWDVSARRNAFKNGISNTIAHRTEHMDTWMSAATQRMQPVQGDQFRMHF